MPGGHWSENQAKRMVQDGYMLPDEEGSEIAETTRWGAADKGIYFSNYSGRN